MAKRVATIGTLSAERDMGRQAAARRLRRMRAAGPVTLTRYKRSGDRTYTVSLESGECLVVRVYG